MAIPLRLTAVMIGGLLIGQTAAVADEAQPKPQSSAAAATPSTPSTPSTCLTATGTRIAVKDRTCTSVGHSYTQDDMQRTGATTAAGALQLLDPAITIHR